TGRSLTGLSRLGLTPAGNTRSSRESADPLGAAPPPQLAPVVQFESGPCPLQVNVAGARRVSSCSSVSRRGGVAWVFCLERYRERNRREKGNEDIRQPSGGAP